MKRRMPAVCLAFSGGLDTTYCALLLREEGYRVHAVTVDTGGFSPREKRTIAARARASGVERHLFLDGRGEVFERYALPLIFGNVLRGGVYPLSVAAERAVQVAAAAAHARRIGARAIAHGSTAAGNDQFRFDAAPARARARNRSARPGSRFRDLARRGDGVLRRPRREDPGEDDALLRQRGALGNDDRRGRDARSVASSPPETLYPGNTLAKAPRRPRLTVVGFRKGRPVALDGRSRSGLDLVERLNTLGRRYAAGRAIHLGDTILGAKGRIVFEAPAALALIAAHGELEKLVMTKEQRQLKSLVAETYGRLLHEGLAFEPALSDADAFLRATQARVTGEAKLRFSPGRFEVVGVRSPHSLLRSSLVRYGESNAYLSPPEAKGVGKTLALPGRLWKLAGATAKEPR